jgi:DNA repair protein RecO (recombination protein O)
MSLYHTTAVILRRMDFREADRIITFFTNDFGKIKCIAKGSRRFRSKFSGKLEPFTFVRIIYFGKENQNIYQINSCDIIRSFHKIGEDYKRLNICSYIVELIDTMFKERDPNRELLGFLLNIFSLIEESSDIDTVLRIFEVRFLSLLGYKPVLDLCVRCNSPVDGAIRFNLIKGGVICRDCFRNTKHEIKISQGALNFIKKSLTIDILMMGRLKIPKRLEEEIRNLIHSFLNIRIGKKLKSYEFLF